MMNEDLLGYLLRALDADQQRQVSMHLAFDQDARRRLEALRTMLAPLEICPKDYDAPRGLASRTCAWVFGAADPPQDTPLSLG
jgi:hypothetical protein